MFRTSGPICSHAFGALQNHLLRIKGIFWTKPTRRSQIDESDSAFEIALASFARYAQRKLAHL